MVRKAKQADLRKYVESGVEDAVMEKFNLLKERLADDDKKQSFDLQSQTPGPLQDALTRRKGTLTVIAEYKRKFTQAESGYVSEMFDPEQLSPTFREFGASGIAVCADERVGGCDYKDVAAFVEEQRRARNEVPGSVPIVNSDIVVDELQVAQTAAAGAVAFVATLDIVGEDAMPELLVAAKALDLEAIVSVKTKEEAQTAIDLGARILLVNVDGPEQKVAAVEGLTVPEGQQVCKVANILAKADNKLGEIEECWAVRDNGFQCAWIGEGLYKAGGDASEHPGAIIRSIKSKSSLKWATPKASGGKGEGAREYLGDIMM